MTDRAHTMTVAEFERFIAQPENIDRIFELIDGELVEKMPTEEHGDIILNIGTGLKLYLRDNPIGRVTTDARHGLPDDEDNDFRPDISFILDPNRERVRKGPIPQMPDFAVEVKSPDDKLPKLRRKVAYYLDNGVRLVWLVIPEKGVVEVYRPDEPVMIFGVGDTLDGGDVLPGFTITVQEILGA